MNCTVQTEKEEDGRWLAEVSELPGVLVYAESKEEAVSKAKAKALALAALRIAWSTAKLRQIWTASPSSQRESLAS